MTNHTKIYTNKNFPLYGSQCLSTHRVMCPNSPPSREALNFILDYLIFVVTITLFPDFQIATEKLTTSLVLFVVYLPFN